MEKLYVLVSRIGKVDREKKELKLSSPPPPENQLFIFPLTGSLTSVTVELLFPRSKDTY